MKVTPQSCMVSGTYQAVQFRLTRMRAQYAAFDLLIWTAADELHFSQESMNEVSSFRTSPLPSSPFQIYLLYIFVIAKDRTSSYNLMSRKHLFLYFFFINFLWMVIYTAFNIGQSWENHRSHRSINELPRCISLHWVKLCCVIKERTLWKKDVFNLDLLMIAL